MEVFRAVRVFRGTIWCLVGRLKREDWSATTDQTDFFATTSICSG